MRRLSIHMNRITPVHPAGDGVSPRLLRRLIFQALAQTDLDAVPHLLSSSTPQSVRDIHFPATFEQLGSQAAIGPGGVLLPFSS